MREIRLRLFASTVLAICLASCSPPVSLTALPDTVTPLDLVAQAEAEATAIVQQARATALVMQAQAQAAQLVEQAGPTQALIQTVAPTTMSPASLEAKASVVETASSAGSGTPSAPDTVELLGVGFAAEGSFIIVNFKASPSITQTWWQGSIEVIDEASGTVYNEIPVLPVIGPLIGRPVEAGQRGYVMLTHNPPMLRPGSLVTVMLGEYKFEHVKIQ